MSDPVTNVEIEDVLSSIRRLVSNESRDTGKAPAAPLAPARASGEQAQKLVLTPSFRVDDAAPADARSDEGAGDTSDETDSDWDAVEPHGASHDAAHEDDADWDEVDPDTGADEADDAEASGSAADAPTRSAETLKARVAELEQVVARRADRWEPDGTSDDEYAGGPVDPLPWEDYVPSDTGGDADGATEAGGEDDLGADDSDTDHTDSDDVSDAPEARAADPAPEEWSDESETDFEADDEDSPMPEGTESEDRLDENFLADDGDDAILDEDSLRDLVTEIVRQELQGGLGERITRNVRKLVRREIHRALASQELE